MVTCAATLGVPRHVVEFLARLLARHRRQIGTPKGSRALGPFRQAVLVLRWFRDRSCVHCLARDAGISQATGQFVKYQLLEPEHANWRAGHRAAVAYCKREGHLNVPYTMSRAGRPGRQPRSRAAGFRLGGGCRISGGPCAPGAWRRSGPRTGRRWGSCGDPRMRRGRRTSRPRGPTSTCTGRWRHRRLLVFTAEVEPVTDSLLWYRRCCQSRSRALTA